MSTESFRMSAVACVAFVLSGIGASAWAQADEQPAFVLQPGTPTKWRKVLRENAAGPATIPAPAK